MRTLADVIAHLDELDDALTIYAAPRWRAASPTCATWEPADGSLPPSAAGMTFMLDVPTAKRAVAMRRGWRPGRTLSLADKCDAIIYFAIYDESEPLPSSYGLLPKLPLAV